MEEWKKLFDKDVLTKEEKRTLCHRLMTTEALMEKLIVKYFTVDDFKNLEKNKIGGGLIGGKACGLLVSRKLVAIRLPDCEEHLEEHYASHVGTDVFQEYLEQNGCGDAHEVCQDAANRDTIAEYQKRIMEGKFSEERMAEFAALLERYGEVPLIVRSSSLMEDGFGNAFAGKYESVFCVNKGTEEERLEGFLHAVKTVYASVLSTGALEYRRRRDLIENEERMGLLIQKVAGAKMGDYYFPVAAGIGCSYNPYKWMEHLDPEGGMIRMVVGLGTRAVERTPGDYPRLVSLDRAQANIRTTVADRHKYSQRKVDVIDLNEKRIRTIPLEKIIDLLPSHHKKMVLSHDTDAEELLAQRRIYRKIYFADCQGLVDNWEFIDMIRRMEKMLEKEYGRPVDVEFAVTSDEPGDFKVNLLQCRPLQAAVSENVHIPTGIDKEVLFDISRTSMRGSKEEHLDYIVYVDPQKYYEYDYYKKTDIAVLISKINRYFKGKNKKLMLLVPGRIGTSSPELGVPVTYADISRFCAICEVAYSKVGYNPDLSYGSHMFQDMVEADVYYGAINENSKTRIYAPQLLQGCYDVLPQLWQEDIHLNEIVKVYDVAPDNARLYLDAKEGRALCRITPKK